MLPSPIKYYQNLDVIKPEWSFFKKSLYSVRSILSMIFQRIAVLSFLFFGFFPFKVKINDRKLLDKAMKEGTVFLGIHSGPFPLAGKIINDFHPDKKVVATFYHKNKISVFPIFRKFFRKLGFTIVALGGAMKEIDPILKGGGSMALFLDARLPVPEKRTKEVKIFGKKRRLSTGAHFLATKYDLNVVPFYVKRKGMTIELYLLPEINYKGVKQEKFLKDVVKSLEYMIEDTLKSWQTYDTFLLD